jgi:parallel beta-helix repeat protein
MGIVMEFSNGITLENNVVADLIQIGIWAKQSHTITMTGNWVHHIPPEVDEMPIVR